MYTNEGGCQTRFFQPLEKWNRLKPGMATKNTKSHENGRWNATSGRVSHAGRVLVRSTLNRSKLSFSLPLILRRLFRLLCGQFFEVAG